MVGAQRVDLSPGLTRRAARPGEDPTGWTAPQDPLQPTLTQAEGGPTWLMRTLVNSTSTPYEGLLVVREPRARSASFFAAPAGGRYVMLPPSERAHRLWRSRIALEPGQTVTVLVGVDLPVGRASLELWAPDAFTDAASRANWALGLLFGVIAAITLYFAAGTLVLRNRSAGAFSPFSVSMALLTYVTLGYAAAHWGELIPELSRNVLACLIAVVVAASSFGRRFLGLAKNHPTRARLHRGLELVLGLLFVLSLFDVSVPEVGILLAFAAISGSVLSESWVQARGGQAHVSLLAMGWVPLSGAVWSVVGPSVGLPIPGPPEPVFVVCAVATVLWFALAVSERAANRRDSWEAALTQSEQRYAYASRGTHDGIFDWDLTEGTVYLSPRFFDTMRLPDGALSNNPQELLNLVHQEDRAMVYRGLRAAFKEHSQDTLQTEFRGLFGDHSVRWVSLRGLLVRETGRVVRLVGSVTDIHARKLNELKLERRAFSDEVTGLPNRARVEQYLQTLLDIRREDEAFEFGILFIDLDRFKNVNDSLGHMVGDRLLATLGRRLALVARDEDLVGRLGGDEFVLVLAGAVSLDDVERVGRRVLEAFEDPVNLEGIEVRSSASIGITHSGVGYSDVTSVLADADMAMYEAKRAGKSRCVTYNARMRDRAVVRLSMEADLRRSVEDGDFQIYYQPIVRAQGRGLAGFEALMRWKHPRRGFVSPVEFIPLAEETGLIRRLGRFALQEATRQIAEWQDCLREAEQWYVTVNVSPAQFGHELLDEVSAALDAAKLEPSRLRLEITEGLFIGDSGAVQAEMEKIAAYGVTFSLDDFGTGYSSLSYLHRLPFATLKIDRAFVQSLLEDRQSEAIVKSVLALAQGLGVDTVAEGVETEAVAQRLAELGSSYFQGFYFGRPLSAGDLERDLRAKGYLASLSA